MAEPRYPLFLFDGLDLLISASYKRLQGDVEPIDVSTGVSDVFDSDGRRVKLETTGWRIEAKVDSAEPSAHEDFGEKLRDYLRAVNDPVADNPDCDLPCLMEAALNRV